MTAVCWPQRVSVGELRPWVGSRGHFVQTIQDLFGWWKSWAQSSRVLMSTSIGIVSETEWAEIQSAVQGDGLSYGQLVARYQVQISRFLWKFSRDPQVHEELVQTVFVEAYLQLRTFAGRCPFVNWLQVIATRVGYRHWKQQSRRREAHLVSLDALGDVAASQDGQVASADLEMTEAATQVHESLAQLPPRDRLVLTLMYLEEKSVAEIAQLTGWSQTMVKVQAYRARGKLGRLLKEPVP